VGVLEMLDGQDVQLGVSAPPDSGVCLEGLGVVTAWPQVVPRKIAVDVPAHVARLVTTTARQGLVYRVDVSIASVPATTRNALQMDGVNEHFAIVVARLGQPCFASGPWLFRASRQFFLSPDPSRPHPLKHGVT